MLTEEQISRRYGVSTLQNNEWIVAVRATRESPGIDVQNNHGFIDVLIPKGKGKWQLFPFGKFSAKFPVTSYERIAFLADTQHARIGYGDESHFYSHRQHAVCPYVVTEEKGLAVMDLIKETIEQCREGNVIFQYLWESCAFWPQQVVNKTIDPDKNFFRTAVLEAKSVTGFLGFLFRFFNRLPKPMAAVGLILLDTVLGSFRSTVVRVDGKKVKKSASTSPYREEFKTFNPAFLHHQIESGTCQGKINFGHSQYNLPSPVA